MKDLKLFYTGENIGTLRVDHISGDRNGNVTISENYGLDDRRPTLPEDTPTSTTSRRLSLSMLAQKLPLHLGEIIDWAAENDSQLIMEDVASKLPSEVLVGTVTEFTTDSPLPNGATTVAYSQTLTFTTTTGDSAIRFVSGALPTGLTLTGATIAGTPTVAGTYTFVLRLVDTNYPVFSVDKEYSITIA